MLSAQAAVSNAPSRSGVADRLLQFLRQTLNRPALQYEQKPEPVPGGYESIILSFSLESAPPDFAGPLILRLLRRRGDPERARREALIQNTVRRLGFPAPRVMLSETSSEPLGA